MSLRHMAILLASLLVISQHHVFAVCPEPKNGNVQFNDERCIKGEIISGEPTYTVKFLGGSSSKGSSTVHVNFGGCEGKDWLIYSETDGAFFKFGIKNVIFPVTLTVNSNGLIFAGGENSQYEKECIVKFESLPDGNFKSSFLFEFGSPIDGITATFQIPEPKHTATTNSIQNAGLSTGAIIGISVGVFFVILISVIFVVVLIFILSSCRQHQLDAEIGDTQSEIVPVQTPVTHTAKAETPRTIVQDPSAEKRDKSTEKKKKRKSLDEKERKRKKNKKDDNSNVMKKNKNREDSTETCNHYYQGSSISKVCDNCFVTKPKRVLSEVSE